jgi:ATP-dependent DNA helicase RecG
MTTQSTLDQLAAWMNAEEGGHFEFKEAKTRYDFEKLVKYCCALANEGGGKIILGVTDRKSRRVVGTAAFKPPQRTEQGINERLRTIKVEAEEIEDPMGRVLVFHVPARPLGVPLQYEGAYWMRSGDQLAPMTADLLQRIFAEGVPDYSAQPCPGARLSDLDPVGIEDFRGRWVRKSGNVAMQALSPEALLTDAELFADGQVTVAALVLFGTRTALGTHLAQAEVVFEYRSSEASLPAQQRVDLRQGFFSMYDQLWQLVNQRNERQAYREGLFVLDLPTFDEWAVREAILNAISHRDYRYAGSVFIRQYPRRIEIDSPGGFPPGITADNILERQSPRNRRIAEAFARCGLVERSGQGVNRMFEEAIRHSKPLPDYSGTDAHQVSVVLRGEIENPGFVRYLEKLGDERLASFTTADLLTLDCIQREVPLPQPLVKRAQRLLEMGAVERIGRGRGVRYILSRALYAHLGKKGVYTRKRGLDAETNKELLLKHLRGSVADGSPQSELAQVLPALSRRQVWKLLSELRSEGRARMEGTRRGARWYAVAPAPMTHKGKK